MCAGMAETSTSEQVAVLLLITALALVMRETGT